MQLNNSLANKVSDYSTVHTICRFSLTTDIKLFYVFGFMLGHKNFTHSGISNVVLVGNLLTCAQNSLCLGLVIDLALPAKVLDCAITKNTKEKQHQWLCVTSEPQFHWSKCNQTFTVGLFCDPYEPRIDLKLLTWSSYVQYGGVKMAPKSFRIHLLEKLFFTPP